MRGQLREKGVVTLVDLDFEEEVRRGRLRENDELMYTPWTGTQFQRLRDIPQLAEAFDAPDARFGTYFLARRFPWAILGLFGLLCIAGAAQFGFSALNWFE